MAVNMAYVPKPESGTKVFKMTPPWNGSADIALTSEKQKQSFLLAVVSEENLCPAIIFSKKTTMQNARSAADYAWNR